MAAERREFGNTTKLGSILDRLNAGDESARDELIAESFERIDKMASAQLNGFPRLRQKGRVDTADVSTDVLLDLRKALGKVQIESGRHFVNLAALKIRRKLLDLARRYKRRIEREETNAAAKEGGEQRVDREGNGLERAGRLGGQDVFRLRPDKDGLSFAEWEAFHTTVDQLPESQRETFILRHYGGWSHAEIAAIVGVSEDAAKKRYASAKRGLAQILSTPED